jgi:Flp pilus assembly protein TadD
MFLFVFVVFDCSTVNTNKVNNQEINYIEAISDFNRVLSINPNDRDAYNNREFVLQQLNRR